MLIKVVAMFCHLAAGGTEACENVAVADSTVDETVTMQSCMMGEVYVVSFMQKNPLYASQRMAGWKCQIGARPLL